ncbi:response regulator [Solidesulfovibrio carbinolicus]|uniref:Two-component system response regulator n=1 Tax=Solidesulfovibrio carbinolicus TaxID=296842 RepID=A0A4P6HH04_9BACT|nr:response regulator [Solidesulfovibrio carbinolicus]QAZ65746.1 two-component system response regulator [Solidesulfovibrio carbinolicus]
MPMLIVADDSMFQRFQSAKTAKEAGYEVIEAKDGAECLRLLREHHPDVLLLDLNMPDPGGVAVLEALAAEAAEIRVCVVTADIQETTKARCLELGARAFLNKPVDHDVLRRILADLLAECGC